MLAGSFSSRKPEVAILGRPHLRCRSAFAPAGQCRTRRSPRLFCSAGAGQHQHAHKGSTTITEAQAASVDKLTLDRRGLLTSAGASATLLGMPWQAWAFSGTVFVAGASGNTGRRVVQQLSQRGIPVRAGLRDVKKAESLGFGSNVTPVSADVTQPGTLREAIGNADIVISALGASGSDLSGPKKIDNQGTKALIDAAKEAGVKKLVLLTSLLTNGAAVGQGLNPNYLFLQLFGGVLSEKHKAEEYLRSSGLPWVIVRPGGLSNSTPSEVGQLVLSGEDTLFGRKEDPGREISRDTVAQVLVEAALQDGARNRVVEIVANKNAQASPLDKWFS